MDKKEWGLKNVGRRKKTVHGSGQKASAARGYTFAGGLGGVSGGQAAGTTRTETGEKEEERGLEWRWGGPECREGGVDGQWEGVSSKTRGGGRQDHGAG